MNSFNPLNSYAISADMGAGSAGTLSASPVTNQIGGVAYLNPQTEAERQRRLAEQSANEELRRQLGAQATGYGMANTARNAEAQRAMALNAQQNAAENIRNQLSNLANIRATNASAINNALGAIAGFGSYR